VSRGGAALALLPEIVRIAIPAPIPVGLELLTCYSVRLVLRESRQCKCKARSARTNHANNARVVLGMWNYLHIKGKALPK